MSLKNMFMMNQKACYFAQSVSEGEIRVFRFKGGVKSVVASITDTEQSGLLFCETDGQSEIVARLIKDPERKFNGSLSNDADSAKPRIRGRYYYRCPSALYRSVLRSKDSCSCIC